MKPDAPIFQTVVLYRFRGKLKNSFNKINKLVKSIISFPMQLKNHYEYF